MDMHAFASFAFAPVVAFQRGLFAPTIETIVYLHRKLNDTTAREETEHPAMQSVVYKDRKLI